MSERIGRDNFSPTYWEGVDAYLAANTQLLKSIAGKLDDPREKKLLLARLHMLQSKFDEAIEICLGLSDFSPHIKAEKHLQLATIYSIKNRFEMAIAENLGALEYFKSQGHTQRIYAVYYNLSVDFSLLRLRYLATEYLDKAETYATLPEEYLEIARAKACHYSQNREFDRAIEILARAKPYLTAAKDVDAATFCLVACDVCVRAGDFSLAQDYLDKIKSKKNYYYKQRVNYQSCLLKFLGRGLSPVLPKLKGRVDATAEYGLQWRLLKALQNGELKETQAFWIKLQKIRPKIYGEFLKPAEEGERNSLFFRSIEKINPERRALRDNYVNLTLSGNLQKAYEIFLGTPTPLRKEEIIEKLWGVPYSTDYDSRFYKLIERLKTKIPAKLIQRNRAYILEPVS